MQDAQGRYHGGERAGLARLDGCEEVLGALLAHALQRNELLARQPVDVRVVPDEPLVQQDGHQPLSESLDVHRPSRDEVLEPLVALGLARGVHAPVHGLALLADDGRAADRAVRRHLEGNLGTGAPFHDRPDHLRDDLAGTLDDDVVADADVLPPDVVLVVEGRLLDRHAADLDGLEDGVRVEAARPPDVDADVQQLGDRLLGRELVGDRPPRLASDEAQVALEVQAVYLHHDAVGLVVLLGPLLHPPSVVAGHAFQGVDDRHLRVHAQPELAQPRHHLRLGRRGLPALGPAELVDPNVQAPACRDAGVELA